MKFAVAAATLAVAACAASTQRPQWHELDSYSFEQYEQHYQKKYSNKVERVRRREHFERELEAVRAHNKRTDATWKAGINHMSDWSEQEKKGLRGLHNAASKTHRAGLLGLGSAMAGEKDSCNAAHTDETSCNADRTTGGGCVWCKSAAVQSACYSVANSKQLPGGVFACDIVPSGGGPVDPSTKPHVRKTFKATGAPVPRSRDYRTAEPAVLTAVKDQGRCGSCWTFASAETIESHWALATGNLQALSEQQIASCASNPRHCGGTGGCEGGTAQIAFQSIMDMGGLASEWTYPYMSYQGQDQKCVHNSSTMANAAKVADFVDIESNDEDSLLEAVATLGPIAISVDATSWGRYEAGIMNTCNVSSPSIDHAVQLVGYGEEKGEDGKMSKYWIVRNSWSPTWGEQGFIRVQRGGGSSQCGWDTTPADGSGCTGGPDKVYVCGMCGILYDNAYPVVDASK